MGSFKLIFHNGLIKLLIYFPNISLFWYDQSTNQWQEQQVEHTVGRVTSCVTVVDDNIYMVGGKNFELDSEFSNAIERFSESAGRFINAGHLLTARAGASCASLNGKVIVAGGYNDNNGPDLASVEEFDPKSGQIKFLAPMLRPRSDFYITPCDEGLLVIDDWITRRKNVEYYSPETNRWCYKSSLDLTAKFVVGATTIATAHMKREVLDLFVTQSKY